MQIKEINVNDLNDRIEAGEKVNLLDVREEFEHQMVNITGTLIPVGQLEDRLSEIEHLKDEEVVVYCRSGARSAEACRIMMRNGFKNPVNMQGGINNWSSFIDPSMPIY